MPVASDGVLGAVGCTVGVRGEGIVPSLWGTLLGQSVCGHVDALRSSQYGEVLLRFGPRDRTFAQQVVLHAMEGQKDLDALPSIAVGDVVFELLLSLQQSPFHFEGRLIDRAQLKDEHVP